MPVEVLEGAVFVSEDALGAIHALLGLEEGPTVLALELLGVVHACGKCKLVLVVSFLTLVFIAALLSFDELSAEFGLKLAVGVH